MKKVCAFFGHRNIPENLRSRLHDLVEQAITKYDITEFWDGWYGGFDELAAEVVISLKLKYPHIRLKQVYAYMPKSNALRRGFDGNIYPDMLEQFPDLWHIPRRNMWMAAQCDMAITYIEHADSRIHEPVDWLIGKKPVFNLGEYQLPNPE